MINNLQTLTKLTFKFSKMAHSIARIPPIASNPISTPPKEKIRFPSLLFPRPPSSHHDSNNQPATDRRTVTLGLTGALSSLVLGEVHNARAAGRRPPAPPPKEKNDPSVSGVLAKVLASKKRKEAMKQAMIALREKGKPIEGP